MTQGCKAGDLLGVMFVKCMVFCPTMLSQVRRVRSMGRLRILEVDSKSALSRVKGMSFKWGLNPYRGCQHGCWYCYARETHTYLELGAGEDFERTIVVKRNIADRLRVELSSTRRERSEIAIGTATDPYQPVEGTYKLTRRCLEVLADRRWPFGLITKNSMIVRDIDVLQDCSRRCAKATIVISLPILDDAVSAAVEPRTAPPRRRLATLRRLRDAGISAGINLAPIMPGLTDSESQIREVFRAATDHGAQFVGAAVLRLKPTVGEHFIKRLGARRPNLAGRYRRFYSRAYAPRPYQSRIMRIVDEARRDAGLDLRPMPANAGDSGFAQLRLPLSAGRSARR